MQITTLIRLWNLIGCLKKIVLYLVGWAPAAALVVELGLIHNEVSKHKTHEINR